MLVLSLSGLVADVENKMRQQSGRMEQNRRKPVAFGAALATYLPDAACLLLHCSPKQSRHTVAFLRVSVTAL